MEVRPVPLPRSRSKPLNGCQASDYLEENGNNQVPKSVDVDNNCVPKPVPRPRARLPKTPPQQQVIQEESDDGDTEEPLPLCMLKPKEPLTADDNKRRTINLFRRDIDNPFADFDASLGEAPLTKLEPEWEKFQLSEGEDKSSDDADSDNEDPPSYVPTPIEEKRSFCGTIANESCNRDTTDLNDEIPEFADFSKNPTYDRISSYSSSESGISSEDNQFSSITSATAECRASDSAVPPPRNISHSNGETAAESGHGAQKVFQITDVKSLGYSVVNKPKRHEYDEVAKDEDSRFYIKEAKPSSNGVKVVDDKDLVKEFDPLFHKQVFCSESVERLDNLQGLTGSAPITASDAMSTGSSVESIDTPPPVPRRQGFSKPPQATEVTPPNPPSRKNSGASLKESPLAGKRLIALTNDTPTPHPLVRSGSSKLLKRISGMIHGGAQNRNEQKEVPSTSLPSESCPNCGENHADISACKFTIQPSEISYFAYTLYKLHPLKKDYTKRWGALTEGQLQVFSKQTDSKWSDAISLDKVVLAVVREEANNMYPFQFYVKTNKLSAWNLAAISHDERMVWLQKYLELFTPLITKKIVEEYQMAGWCFVKEGIMSPWHASWLILVDRKILCHYIKTGETEEIDLRKIRSIELKKKDDRKSLSEPEILTIDCGAKKILDIQTISPKITSVWEKTLKSACFYNGETFEEMQLTHEDVPVIVHKCIEFLYGHGVITEGIYRQSGSASRITALLEEFKKDAWSVQMSELTPHDVAGALKRFFRNLPEPVVTSKLYDQWIAAYSIKNLNKQHETYKALLESLPTINYNILKKLICHLYTIHELHERNLMPIDNLAPIWGPTLMSVEQTLKMSSEMAQSYEVACAQCGVVKDLIENYYTLFGVSAEEIAREKKIQHGLEKVLFGANQKSYSGDIRIYVYVKEWAESTAVNISLNPTATATSVLESIAAQTKSKENMSLFEVVPSRCLERPLYPTDIVMETIVRWPSGEEDGNKRLNTETVTPYLIAKPNPLYHSLVPYANNVPTIQGEFNFADGKSKAFRKSAFEYWNGTLRCYKEPKAAANDSDDSTTWHIRDIVWYLGIDPKKVAPTKWNVTFISKSAFTSRSRRNSKDDPYAGQVMSFSEETEMLKLLAAFVISEHPEGLYPAVIL